MFIKILVALLALTALGSAQNVTVTGEGVTMVFNGEKISDGEPFSFTFNESPISMDGVIKHIVGHVLVDGIVYPVFKENNFLKHVQEGDYHPAIDSNSYYFARKEGKSYVVYEFLSADGQEVIQATNLTMIEG